MMQEVFKVDTPQLQLVVGLLLREAETNLDPNIDIIIEGLMPKMKYRYRHFDVPAIEAFLEERTQKRLEQSMQFKPGGDVQAPRDAT